jgi:hypothetical protein
MLKPSTDKIMSPGRNDLALDALDLGIIDLTNILSNIVSLPPAIVIPK